jgi:hypothetical protein
MTHMTQDDAPFIEGAIACARIGLSWKMRHSASCVTPEGTTTGRLQRVFLASTPIVLALL